MLSAHCFKASVPTTRTRALTRERNRSRRDIGVLECREVSPEQVGFPRARLIARLRRRVRRKAKKTTETVYLISSLTLEQLDALGWIKLKRGYWVIESRLHHALDVSLDEDRSRVRNPNAALVLGMFVAWWSAWLKRPLPKCKLQKRAGVCGVITSNSRIETEPPASRRALVFAKAPASWRLQ